jgi:MYXO-CTERM domain-containing protein
MKALLRGLLASGLGSGVLLSASLAFAAGEICFNDTDCPGGGAVCGGDVCDWNQKNAMGTTEKPYTCIVAGSSGKPKGQEGWCSDTATSEHCKCKGEGAKCVGVYCTFTKASDAPAGAAGSGAGGSSSTAGTSSTAGAPSTAGTSSTAGSGGSAAKEEDSGGCSVVSPSSTGGGIALALGVLGLGFAVARRRR